MKSALNRAADGPRSTRTMQDIKDARSRSWRFRAKPWYNLAMDTAVKISSFAAPTPEDIAAFEQLTPDEQRALIRAELDKGFDGQPVSLTDHTSQDIFAKAMARVAKSRAPR